jgi:hypothetical protein
MTRSTRSVTLMIERGDKKKYKRRLKDQKGKHPFT